MRFRKKPVVVDAVRVLDLLDCAAHNWKNLPDWIREAYDSPGSGTGIVFAPDAIFIKTLEGEMRADIEDWLIRGTRGELYPCKPDIFKTIYEPCT